MLTRTRPGTGAVLRRAADLADGGFPVALEGIAADDVAAVLARPTWNHRTPDSWEHVMPYGVRVHDQRRLPAPGDRVRVVIGARR